MSETMEYCDCYKKLSLLGIPLFISEENADYSENGKDFFMEKAFAVPEFIKVDEKVNDYPVIDGFALPFAFERMSQIIRGLGNFEVDVLSFWMLDAFVEGLWTAQESGMEHEHQKATLLWIAYFFNYIIKNNPTRKKLFSHLKEVLFQLAEDYAYESSEVTLRNNGSFSSESSSGAEGRDDEASWINVLGKRGVWVLPLPPLLDDLIIDEEGIFSKSSSNDLQSIFQNSESIPDTSVINQNSVQSVSERNVLHMNIIINILYRIFGRLWVYMEIQGALHNMPNVEIVELPFVLHRPKRVQILETFPQSKVGKKPILQEKLQEEIDAEKELHKNDFILPLQVSEEAKAFSSQFFTPASEEKKGRGDKRK